MLFGLEQRRSILTQWQHDILGLWRFQASSSLIRENQEFWWLIICRNCALQKQLPAHSSPLQLQLCMIIKLCVSSIWVGKQTLRWPLPPTTPWVWAGSWDFLAQGPHGLPWIGRDLKVHIKKPKMKVTYNPFLHSISLEGFRVFLEGTVSILVLLLLLLSQG